MTHDMSWPSAAREALEAPETCSSREKYIQQFHVDYITTSSVEPTIEEEVTNLVTVWNDHVQLHKQGRL
eukprot:12884731-Prorocentrum_lima.AAC.1